MKSIAIKARVEAYLQKLLKWLKTWLKWLSDELKNADIIPVYEKQDVNDKTSYQSISLLPIILKIFGKVLYFTANKYFH